MMRPAGAAAEPAPTRITSRANPLLLRLRRLVGDPAAYRKQREIWLEGEHLCRACLQSGGRPSHALVSEPAWDGGPPALRQLAGQAAAVSIVAPALLAAVSALEAPPAIAFLLPWAGEPAPLAGSPTVVLDRLQDAGNVGTILRCAAAFGVIQVISLKGTAALWSPKVLRAAMGAHFALTLVERVDGADIDALRSLGLPLIATSPHAEQAIHEASLPWPCAWLFGHEGQGVAPALLAACDRSLRIPQPGGEESPERGCRRRGVPV